MEFLSLGERDQMVTLEGASEEEKPSATQGS